MTNELVTIATFTLPQESFIIKGRLESEGIYCSIKDELTIQTDNFLSNAIGGVKLQVRSEDVDRAKAILQEVGYTPPESHDSMALWKKIDRITNKVPLLSILRVELRFLVIIALCVSLPVFLYLWFFNYA